MNNLLIVRINFPPISPQDTQRLYNTLHILTQFTLKPFINTQLSVKCYIQLSEEIEPIILDYLTHTDPLPGHILFTSKPIRDIIRNELDTLTTQYNFFYFLNLAHNVFCHKDFLTTLFQYVPVAPVRSLLFRGYSQYNISTHTLTTHSDEIFNQFIYICSIKEYQMYFRIYDYYYPATLNQKFKLFPFEEVFLNACTVIRYTLTTSPLPQLIDIDYFVNHS